MTIKTEHIARSWAALEPRHTAIIERFYERLFKRFPEYARHFDFDGTTRQNNRKLAKMVHTLALLAEYCDHRELIRPRLQRLGAAHRELPLSVTDFHHFTDALVETLSDEARDKPDIWGAECERAWRAAFRQVIGPELANGLTATPNPRTEWAEMA